MAMPRSLAPLLLLVAMSAVPAGLAGRVPASDSLTKACNATSEMETCVNVLKSNPESATASPPQLAGLAFQYLVKDGPLLVAEAKSEYGLAAATKDEATLNCLRMLDESISAYVDPVIKLAAPVQGDAAQFTEAKNKLTELLRRPSDSGAVCSDAVIKTKPVVLKIYKYKRMMQVTFDLMEAAAPSKGEGEKKMIQITSSTT